jgi:BON domain-containing protein
MFSAMGLMRALGRAGTLAAVGAAAGYFLRRSGVLGEPPPILEPAPEPPFEPLRLYQPEPASADDELEVLEGVAEEVEPDDSTHDVEPVPEDAEVVEIEPEPVPQERADVTAVVDDLLAARRPQEGAITEAEVVSASSEDVRLAEAVRVALAEEPGLLSAPIDIEVLQGRVKLLGELDRPEVIAAVERKVDGVDGVLAVQSLLHMPGTPPPKGP